MTREDFSEFMAQALGRGVSTAELATHMGVSEATVVRWATGESSPVRNFREYIVEYISKKEKLRETSSPE